MYHLLTLDSWHEESREEEDRSSLHIEKCKDGEIWRGKRGEKAQGRRHRELEQQISVKAEIIKKLICVGNGTRVLSLIGEPSTPTPPPLP